MTRAARGRIIWKMKKPEGAIAFLFLLFSGCALTEGLPSLELGRYKSKSYALRDDSQVKQVTIARKTIEKHLKDLKAEAESLSGLELEGFRYIYTSVDSVNNVLILRYFSPLRKRDKFYAGVQIQALVDPETGKIVKLLLSKVPYE